MLTIVTILVYYVSMITFVQSADAVIDQINKKNVPDCDTKGKVSELLKVLQFIL